MTASRGGKIIAAVLCGWLLLPGAAAFAAEAASSPSFRSADLESLEGVWRSRGYGWLLEIADGEISFYDESASLCIEDESASSNLQDMRGDFQVSGDGRTIRLPLGKITYQYTFDRIAALPERCGTAPDAGPKSVLNSVVELFSRHYAFFDVRNIDWQALASEARAKVTASTTSDELLDIVGGLIARIDDAHVSLEATKDGDTVWRETRPRSGVLRALAEQARREGTDVEGMTERWEQAYWEDVERGLLDGEGHSAGKGNIRYGLIGGDIGYIAIKAMEGLSRGDSVERDLAALDAAMDRAMALFAGARAVIVDVSINEGGYDAVALALAGRFASKRMLAYYKHAGDSDADRPQPIHIEPNGKRRFEGPVYVMTSDATVSAAEIFVLAMRALPNVTHVGTATRGSLSDVLAKPLPNGWSLNLSNEIYLDVQGRAWEGKGIPPEAPLEVFSREDVTKGHVAAVQTVAAMARRGERTASSRR